MSAERYALGYAALLVVLGSVGIGAVALRAWMLPLWRGAPARLADVVLALALLVGILELLGTFGLLRLVPIVALSAAVGTSLWAWRRPAAVAAAAAPQAARGHRALRAVALGVPLLAAGLVLASWGGPTVRAYDAGIRGFDSIWYHMPWAGSFAQTGQITGIRFLDVVYLTGFYPATAELLHAMGIALMGNDVLSPSINLLWLALVLLAAWCVGHPRGVGGATLVAGALAMATPMMHRTAPGTADNDVVAVFFLLAAVALWLNAADPRTGRADGPALVLVGLAAGLAISVKLNTLAPVPLLCAAVVFCAPAGRRRWVARVVLAATACTGAYWYVRNLVAVGNPLPWLRLGPLPMPTAPLQRDTGYSVASYFSHPHILGAQYPPALADGLGSWWWLIAAIALIAPLLCVWCGRDRVTRTAGVVALASLAAYVITPGTASGPLGDPLGFALNLRYVAPALTIALTTGMLAPPLRAKRTRWVTLAVLGVALVATVARAPEWVKPHLDVALPLATALVALGVGAVLVSRSNVRAWPALGRTGALAGLVALLATGGAAGLVEQHRYLHSRYIHNHGIPSFSSLWRWAQGMHHQRIGIAGTSGAFFAYPLYGLDDSNEVQYIGSYGAHGSFTAITSCRDWRTAVNAGHYRYVVVTPGRDVWTRKLLRSPEGVWIQHDPAAQRVLRRRHRFAVYEISGPLDPTRC